MAKKAPGKSYRKGITLAKLFEMFPNDEVAEEWFINSRWPDGVRCPYCDSDNVKRSDAHATMPFRCNSCKKWFSAKTNSVMHSSKVGYRNWAITLFQVTTNIKGVSSMKLHRDLGVTQRTAWHMLHRIREAYDEVNELFDSEVEVDESYFGGKEANRHARKKKHLGRGTIGKTAVAGLKDRKTNKIHAEVVSNVNRKTMHKFVIENTTEGTLIYTDEASVYEGVPRYHIPINHSVGEYVRGQAHTNGMESFWSMVDRGYMGIYHHMSPKHLHRYICEFQGRHNDRPLDTIDQMEEMVRNMESKRLRYQDLIAGGPAYPDTLEFST